MQICRVAQNKQTFTGEGRDNKTNAGKWVGLGAAGGFLAENISAAGSLKKYSDVYKQELAQTISKEFSGKKPILEETLLRRMANRNLLVSVAGLFGGCVGAGAVLDLIINSVRGEE